MRKLVKDSYSHEYFDQESVFIHPNEFADDEELTLFLEWATLVLKKIERQHRQRIRHE